MAIIRQTIMTKKRGFRLGVEALAALALVPSFMTVTANPCRRVAESKTRMGPSREFVPLLTPSLVFYRGGRVRRCSPQHRKHSIAQAAAVAVIETWPFLLPLWRIVKKIV